MNEQEIFDAVARHLAAQGRRSIAPSGDCRYRGPNGTRCGFGCLIPDPDYDPLMEDKNAGAILDTPWAHLGGRKLNQVHPWMEKHAVLICDVQRAHDCEYRGDYERGTSSEWAASTPSMRVRLERLAAQHELDPTVLTGLTFPEVWT